MKPLPSSDPNRNRGLRTLGDLPVLQSGSPSNSNQRRPGNPLHRAYPWLLLLSTGLSTAFCFLYLTKPVIRTESRTEFQQEKESRLKPEPLPVPTPPKTEEAKLAGQPQQPSALMPGQQAAGRIQHTEGIPAIKAGGRGDGTTNLSVQHVLNAQINQGDLCRIILDVPVLYNSRQLRWTQADVEDARGLLARLADHQEKSAVLREEATQLLGDWNRLVGRSIPGSELRADSPSLPANQGSAPLNLPASLNTSDSIQLKPAGK